MFKTKKFCPTCKRELDISCFNINRSKKDGYCYQCRECQKQNYEKLKIEKAKTVQSYPETKVCSYCKVELPSSSFSKRTASPDGLQPICKNCQTVKDKLRISKIKIVPSQTKLCSYCNSVLDISEFDKSSYNSDGLQSMCKSCRREYKKQNINNEKYIHESGYKQCTGCGKLLPLSEFYISNYEYDGYNFHCKDCCKAYYQRNKQEIARKDKIYREQNRDILNARDREKYNNSPSYRLNILMSSNIYRALRGGKSEQHWEELVNYSLQELKEHLERQFDENMNWDNFGSYWEIDHIIPRNQFNYVKSEDKEFQICWSLANLRPLEKIANRSRPKDGRDVDIKIKQQILGSYNILC